MFHVSGFTHRKKLLTFSFLHIHTKGPIFIDTHKPAEFDFIPIPFPRLAPHHYLFAMCTVLEFSKLFLYSPRSNESINVVTERPFEIFFIFREDLFCEEERSGNGLR